ncbi:MAG: anthranilate synthase component I family protein [Spirochaetaceae bacterium]|jgi:anthranilate synthase component 1|nr:anthranilate synthase component I family protein [Spirochaetaceae bacterium]
MHQISLDALRPFAHFPILPVWRKTRAEKTPVEAFRKFKLISRQCFILESLEDKERWGRWTFLGFEPKLEISAADGKLSVKNGATLEAPAAESAAYIERLLAEYRSPRPAELAPGAEMPPFSGGLVGYFSFDFVKYREKRLQTAPAASEQGALFKDFDLMLFDKLIVWDNLKNETYFFVNVKTGALEEAYHRAITELDRLQRILRDGADARMPPLRIKSPFRELCGRERYREMVIRAKKHIVEGDIFQVVLSNQLEAEVEGSIFGAYLVLRRANPSPYMFYFASDDIEISGASPETLVKLTKDPPRVWTFPLAGTRRRGKTPEEDAALEKELLADPKELAEHNMLVDLGRNDLGRICEFGTVKVEKYLSVERFSHVMHIGSTVSGLPRAGALEAIAAVLPAGTLSGAPKIRAIEIINELEAAPRGIYGGAIGYLAFSGDMDTCISIRIAYKKGEKVYVRSGAGIVADSVPESEYEECRNKMRAVVAALEEAAK